VLGIPVLVVLQDTEGPQESSVILGPEVGETEPTSFSSIPAEINGKLVQISAVEEKR